MDGIEKALPLAEAARRWLPPSRTGQPIRPSVLWRWAEYGLCAGDRRVRLHVTRVGGQRYVTQADLQKFLDDLNEAPPDDAVTSPGDEPKTGAPSTSNAKQHKATALAVLG